MSNDRYTGMAAAAILVLLLLILSVWRGCSGRGYEEEYRAPGDFGQPEESTPPRR